MENKYSKIALNIKRLRKQHKMTQKRLAELLNVTPATVSKWEVGTNYPADHLTEIAEIFNVTVDDLLGKKINQSTAPTDLFEHIETFCLPNRDGVFADLVKDNMSRNYLIYLYDFHYDAIKLLVHYCPFENYTAQLFKEEFLSMSDSFLRLYRDKLDASGMCDVSPEERAVIEYTEKGFDDIEDMHKRLGID